MRKALLTLLFVFGLCLAGLLAEIFVLRIQRYQGLGHGFFLLSRWEPIKGGFESVYHYQELHHHLKNLGMTGQVFVSPSGRFALYESFDREGHILLFDADSGKTGDVTDGDFAIPSETEWHEPEHQAGVLYYENHKPSLIRLPN